MEHYWKDIDYRKKYKSKIKNENRQYFLNEILVNLNKELIQNIKELHPGQFTLYTEKDGLIDIFINTNSLRIREKSKCIKGYESWLKENNYI